MPRFDIDLNPVTYITVDAIGKPGQRVFYLQGRQEEKVVSLIVEKYQVQTMALGVEEFLSEILSRFPNLASPSTEYNEDEMRIKPPVDPLFRVGDLSLAYDTEKDLLVLLAKEIQTDPNANPEDASVVRFWCTRSQILAMCRWGLEITERGRPICPQCGQPMDPEGHFCPKKNGNKRK